MLKQDADSQVIFNPELDPAQEESLITSELRAKITEQQLTALLTVMKYVSLAGLIFAWLSFEAMYGSVDHTILTAWALAISAVSIFRYYLAKAYDQKRSNGQVNVQRWIRYTFVVVLIQSIAWGSLPFCIRSDAPPGTAAFVVYLMSALSFGGFTTLGFVVPIYAANAIPLFVATLYWFFYLAPGDFIPTAALIMIASLSMMNSARNTEAMWRRTLRLVHEQESLTAQLREEKERALITLKSIGDAVVTTDLAGRVMFVNPSAEALTGWTAETARGKDLVEVLRLVDESTRRPVSDLTQPTLTAQKALKQNIVLLDKFGRDKAYVEITISPVIVPPNRTTGFVVAIHDVTELRQFAKDMTHQAAHDPLTGLLNRRAFEMQLEHVVSSIQHDVSKTHVLCYLDLDNFKTVNDACGHTAGDELLKQIADILRRQVRELDAVSRIGGDEFAIILRGCDIDKARNISEDICAKVKTFDFECNNTHYAVGISIGITDIRPSDSVGAIIDAADNACYASKREGRGVVRLAERPFKTA